jgi:hypothetical protein
MSLKPLELLALELAIKRVAQQRFEFRVLHWVSAIHYGLHF